MSAGRRVDGEDAAVRFAQVADDEGRAADESDADQAVDEVQRHGPRENEQDPEEHCVAQHEIQGVEDVGEAAAFAGGTMESGVGDVVHGFEGARGDLDLDAVVGLVLDDGEIRDDGEEQGQVLFVGGDRGVEVVECDGGEGVENVEDFELAGYGSRVGGVERRAEQGDALDAGDLFREVLFDVQEPVVGLCEEVRDDERVEQPRHRQVGRDRFVFELVDFVGVAVEGRDDEIGVQEKDQAAQHRQRGHRRG
mmetsp:Transcript_27355/g.83977  ORF Transcript_27355/g.83977 Transcript_27355/m.83977 type:complete len:251 (+) Transcript_27355:1561-2313(+)